MMLFGNSVGYWLLVRLAIAAKSRIEQGSKDRFYQQKIATAEFFASQLLTRNAGYLGAIIADTGSYDDFVVEDFYRN